MLKKRIIPIVLIRDGYVVQSKTFTQYRNLGSAFEAVKRLSEWEADELILIDISPNLSWEKNRSDLNNSTPLTFHEILSDTSKAATMPLTCGGGLRSLRQIEERLASGADKVILNSALYEDISILKLGVKEFGSQFFVSAVDVKQINDNYILCSNSGKNLHPGSPFEWIKRLEEYGSGEIFINLVNRDGMKNGFDVGFLDKANSAIQIPLIGCGGAGSWRDFEVTFKQTGINALAAANIFHHQDQSVYLAHKYLMANGVEVRPPKLYSI